MLLVLNERELALTQKNNEAYNVLNNQQLERIFDALKSNPLSSSALMQFSEFAYSKVEYDKAVPVLQQSQKLNGRNRTANLALFNAGIVSGDVEMIARQLTIMMNVNSKQFEKILPVLLVIYKIEEFQDFFIDGFKQESQWTNKFLNALIVEEGTSPDYSLRILRELSKMPDHNFNSAPVVTKLVKHLMRHQRFQLAREIWREFDNNSSEGQVIRNPNFLPTLAPSPFDWQMVQNTHGYSTMQPDGGLIVSSDGKFDVSLASQYIDIRPLTQYRMSLEIQGKAERHQVTFSIMLVCAGQGINNAFETLDFESDGSPNGSFFSMYFDTSADLCASQLIYIIGLKGEYPKRTQLKIESIIIEAIDRNASPKNSSQRGR